MKRYLHLFILSCLSLAALPCLAENQEIPITLNDGNGFSQTAEINCGIITVEATPSSDRETARISISLENTTGNYGLVMFTMNYSDKDRKKLKDDGFYEIVTDNESLKYGTEYVKSLSRNVFIDTGTSSAISLTGLSSLKSLEPKEVTLPIYACIIEKRDKKTSAPKKLKLVDLNAFELKITVELGPDVDFEVLVKDCESLVKEIGDAVFCTNEKHNPSLESQKKTYGDKVNDMKNKIRRFANDRGVSGKNLPEKYNDLIKSLDKALNDIENAAADCGKHKVKKDNSHPKSKTTSSSSGTKNKNVTPPVKQYSASEVLSNLRQIYKELDNGRYKGNKKAAVGAAQTWYNRAKALPDSKTKSAAIKEWNKINNY